MNDVSARRGGGDYAPDASTLTEIVKQLDAAGYRGQFASALGGQLRCLACDTTSRPEEVRIEHIRRTEGASDPADMTAVVALTCPRCGTAGTAVFSYGADATPDDAAVLRQLENKRR